MTLRLIIGAHGTPPHRREHTHTQFYHWHSSRTLRRVRSADPVIPSLPPAGGSPCAADDSQSHRAVCGETAARREKCERCVGVLVSSSTYLTICVPYLLRTLVPGQGATGVPSSREDRAAPVKGGRRVLTPASCRTAVVEKLIGNSLNLGLVLFWSPILFFLIFHFFLLNELFKAMDLRERVSVWALVAGSCCRGDKRERMFGSSDGHSRWVSGLHAGAGEAFHAVCCV